MPLFQKLIIMYGLFASKDPLPEFLLFCRARAPYSMGEVSKPGWTLAVVPSTFSANFLVLRIPLIAYFGRNWT